MMKLFHVDTSVTNHDSYTEFDIAERFAEKYAGHLRYVAALRKWFIWDQQNNVWRRDITLYVFDLARKYCCEECARSGNNAYYLLKARAPTAVLRLARSDRQFATRPSEMKEDLDAPYDNKGARFHYHKETVR